jgi:VCBS repeat-containing protein
VQALAAAATLNDTFTVTAADGTSQVVTVTITGSNDAAVISGTTTGAVIEAGGVNNATAGTLTATGNLTSTDVDGTASSFTAAAAGTASTGGYGTYQLTAGGVWTYTLNDANATVQALAAAATLSDTFTVTTADGTSQVVTVTITGSNDAAVISGTTTGAVIEAGGVNNATAGTALATGTLTSTDVDGVANAFTAAAAGTATTGGYGTYEMSAAGVWTYTLNDANATVQALAAAATLNDTFTVTAADGTSQVVTVTITGSNDAATVTAGGTLAYIENGAATAIDAALTLVDPDSQISGATVTIGNANLVTGDTLGFTAQSGISGSYNSGTGVLTLSGTATAAQYQTALRSVTYSSSSDDPTVNATKLDRTVTWVVTDAQSLAATSVSSTINVTPVPDVTSVVLSATGAVNSTLNAGDVVTATVTFDQAVTVTGTPRVALLIGATTVYADYTAVGSTTTALKFNYTIVAGQTDATGISVAANSLAQNLGSTIQGTTGIQNATLTHAALADDVNLKVDTSAPVTPTFALTSDTGSNASDGITSNGSVTVSGVEANGTWQYSTDGGTTWSASQSVGTTTFTLASATYAANAVQVRSFDAGGMVSTAAQNSGVIVIDSTAPVLDLDVSAGTNRTLSSGEVSFITSTGAALNSAATSVTETNTIASVDVAVNGLINGANEKLRIGSTNLNANGVGVPATVSDGTNTWNVSYSAGSFRFSQSSGTATTAQAQALVQALSYVNKAPTLGADAAMSTWLADGSTATANTSVAPDSTTTADQFSFNTSIASGGIYRTFDSLVIGQSYTFSTWVKLGTATNLTFAVNNGSNWNTYAAEKSFTSTDGLNTTTWTRISQTFTATSATINLHLGSYAIEPGLAGQTAGTVNLWGASLTPQGDKTISTWLSGGVTATADTSVAPDSTSTADQISYAGTANSAGIYKTYDSLIAGQTYTFSTWVKLGTATNLTFAVNNGSNWNTYAAEKSFTATDGLNTSTWTRISQTFTATSTLINLHLGSNGLESGLAAQTAGTVNLWGAGLTINGDTAMSAWNLSSVTTTANTSAAPNNTTTADQFNYAGTASSAGLWKTYSSLAAGEIYTFSAWVKLGTATNLTFAVNNGSNWDSYAAEKSFTATDGLNTTTWVRISQTFTTASTTINMHLGSNGLESGLAEQTAGTVNLWGAKLEFAKNYNPYEFDLPYAQGDRTFSVTATDLAGNTSTAATSTLSITGTTPLLLDLNGDGVHTVGLSAGVVFDVGADGALKRTGWVDSHDGLLALDLNHNGKIDNGAELFGSGTTLADGSKAKDGYAALRQYDANSDGVMDAKDAVFDNLKVWVDADTDGITDAGELKGLTDLGIASINLNALNALGSENGNSVILQSSWTDTNGVAHSLADWTFATDGRQVLVAPDGASTLTGSTGGDVFRLAQGSTGTLTVTDFKASQNDALDLSALLKGAGLTANSTDADLSRYLQLTQSGNDAVFKVDTTGNSNFVAPAETIVFTNGSLNGMNDTLHHLVANGQVILG